MTAPPVSSPNSPKVVCRVATIREAMGESQSGLARKLGVSRQALFLIESGRSVPSTSLALKLATTLRRPVEELFTLVDDDASAGRLNIHWATPPASPAGTRGVVARIGRRLVAHPLAPGDLEAADVVCDGPGGSPKRSVRALQPDDLHDTAAQRLFIAGCAPALGLLCRHLEKAGELLRASWIHATSARALAALGDKEIHVAGLHFPPNTSKEVASPVRGARGRHRLTFATWQQGLLVRRGDRLAPRTVAQLGARGIRLVRREAGASANRLLDAELRAAGIDVQERPALVARGHFGVAAAIALGAADVGVAAEHAAIAHDLDFVPLDQERFELTFDASFTRDPRYQRLGDVLSSQAFRTELQSLGGYDTKQTGSVPSPGGAT
ncbi:MAG TPA: substrate-binding domain-containing protein [Polyangia bacterium]